MLTKDYGIILVAIFYVYILRLEFCALMGGFLTFSILFHLKALPNLIGKKLNHYMF
jgi:hypothetical protein